MLSKASLHLFCLNVQTQGELTIIYNILVHWRTALLDIFFLLDLQLDSKTSTKYTVHIFAKRSLSKIKQVCPFKVLAFQREPRRKLSRKSEDREERKTHTYINRHTHTHREVILTLGESRCLTVGQNVKLLEQFSFPICHDASYPELTKICIYQQTAEGNFQQHCAQSKERHSEDVIKPLEPEWSTDFIVSHRLPPALSKVSLEATFFWENDVSQWASLLVRSCKIDLHYSSLRNLRDISFCLFCLRFGVVHCRVCPSQDSQTIKDSSLDIICFLSSRK